MLLKYCTQYTIGKLRKQQPQNWKRPIFIPIPKKHNAKECSNCHTIALISHASEVMLKILQARLQQNVNWEILDVQAGFRKGRGARGQIANVCWIIEKARKLQKKSTSASLTMLKPLTVWITTNCGKFFSSVSSVQLLSGVRLQPHELQHTRTPCPSPTLGVHSDSCPLSQWCYPAISSSVVPFSSCPQIIIILLPLNNLYRPPKYLMRHQILNL